MLTLSAAACSSASPSSEIVAPSVAPSVADSTTEAPDDVPPVADNATEAVTIVPAENEDAADSEQPGTTNIVVDSTTDDYFILYVRPDLITDREIPVSVTLGLDGSTTLRDGRGQLPDDHYRVETRSVADPGDVDGDGVDDLSELSDPFGNPVNPGEQLSIDDGSTLIPDRETFETLSYQGEDVKRDSYLAGLEFVKFYLIDADTPDPILYFMNTVTHRGHPFFAEAIGLPGGRRPAAGSMRGDIVYNPDGVAPDGTLGTYRFAFQPNDAFSFEEIALSFEMLSTGMPFLTDNLLYEPYPRAALPLYEQERASYDAYRIPILLVESP